MSRDYYRNGKRISVDGVPYWAPKWWGELGNDPEFIEATKPRTSFKTSYYAGGFRMLKDGVPCRLAGYVADWAPWMRRALHRGTTEHNGWRKKSADWAELERQARILGLVKPPKEERAAA